jgi:hypothetical protein
MPIVDATVASDPPQQSYGQVTLTQTIASGTSSDGETDEFQAIFPLSPGLVQPQPSVPAPTTNYFIVATPALSGRACAVAGHSFLSAGTIGIQAPGQNAISAPPAIQNSGVTYQTALPSGFLQPGQYTISAPAGAPVAFQQIMSVGPPISIQTNLAPGTLILASKPPTITWTGGDANSIVRLTLVGNVNEIRTLADVYYVPASAGSVTLQSICTAQQLPSPPGCGFGELPYSGNSSEIIVEVLPSGGIANSIGAQGITQQVQFTWSYRYIFGGLSIGN